MPSYKYSKILPKNIIDLVNNFLKPDESEYLFKFDDCLYELEEVKLIVNTYNNFLYLNDNITHSLLEVIKNRKTFLLKNKN